MWTEYIFEIWSCIGIKGEVLPDYNCLKHPVFSADRSFFVCASVVSCMAFVQCLLGPLLSFC